MIARAVLVHKVQRNWRKGEEQKMGRWDRVVDVVVVGQGIAGACAALEAHRAGAEVLVLERAGGGGGASALSEGIFYLGGGTPVQQACGYEDTAQNLYDFLRASTSHPDDIVVRSFAEGAREHFDWLEQQGVPFSRTAFPGKVVSVKTSDCLLTTGNEKIWPFNDMAQPVPRGHQARSDEVNGGLSAMRALLARCEAEGIETVCNAAVTDLETDADGRVVGVRVTLGGEQQRIGARRGVVVATGSFTNNCELVQQWLPFLSETSSPLGIPSNDGSGLRLAEQAGAALAAMDGVIATASIYPPENLIKGIVVNATGERFVAEDSYHGRLAAFIMEQPDQKAYLIVDSEIFAYPEIEAAKHVLIDGYETVAEMARGLGLPESALERTLDEYNRDAAQGEDTRFHKQSPWLKPLDQAPFAAFDISFDRSIYLYITLGGIDTDARSRVLDRSGRPIAGLYAAGACTAHIPRNGKEYASGLSLGPGSFFGRVAGREAAADSAARDATSQQEQARLADVTLSP